MKQLHFFRFLGIVAALITAAVQHVHADVVPPVRISVPPDAISAPLAEQEFHGVFELAVGERGTLEHLELRGEGWRIIEVIPAPPFDLGAGEIATFTYRAMPRDPAERLTAQVTFSGQAVKRAITVSPQRFAERGKARPSSRVPGSTGLRPGADLNPPVPSSLAGGSVTLRFAGRIQYTRSDGVVMGADGVYFEIVDDDSPAFDEVIVSGKTDVNGFFDVTTDWDDCDALGCDEPDIYLYYETDTDIVSVQTSDILEEDYSWDTEGNTQEDFTGSMIDFGVQFPTDTAEHAALHILTQISRAHRFVLTHDGTFVPHVDAQWPESDNGAFYDPLFNDMHIGPNEQWTEGTIIHEWGHHFLETQAVNLTPDYCNAFCDGDTPCTDSGCGLLENGGHCAWCPETNHDAWNEGFPNWLGSVVMRNMAADYPQAFPTMPTVILPLSINDGRYTGEVPVNCCQDSTNYVGQADITEGFALALLRDVEDGNPMVDNHVVNAMPDCSVDTMNLGVDEILLVTRLDLPTNPLDFINKFRARYPQYDQDFWSTCANVSSVYISQFPLPRPQVISQTQGCQVYTAGQTLSLNVQGNGSQLGYQWRRNGTNLMNAGPISGANLPTLTINPLALTDAGQYDCVVTTCDGTLSTPSAPIRVTVYPALGGGTNVAGFGRNDIGQLGNGEIVFAGNPALPPTPVLNLSQVVQVSAADFQSVALRGDGTVWTWGYNTTQNAVVPSAQQVPGLTDVIAVAAGGETGAGFSLALKADGTVVAWGYNGYGQLGQPDFLNKPNPVLVAGLDCIVSISAGGYTSYAVRSDGTVWSFGFNGHGELGRGTIGGWSATPAPVPGIDDAVTVAAGGYHALVQRANGTALSWGRNLEGQLGDGTNMHQPSPVAVPNLSGVNAVRAGRFSSYAIGAGGALRVWGANNAGQLGTGDFTTHYSPIAHPHIPNVLDVSGGHQHTVFLRPDNTVWAAGNNNYGHLIAGTGGVILTPVQVPGLLNVSNVEAGQSESFALSPGVRPVIIQQPQSQIVTIGQNAQFTVAALGNPQLTYRWNINGSDLVNGSGVSGVNMPTLTINPISAIHAGTLLVFVDNPFGGTMSMPATITIQCAPTDVNCDGMIDANDAGGFVDCVNGPAPGAPIPPLCMPMEFDAADVDGDNDVDLEDVAGLQRCFKPGGPLVMGCAP